MPDLLDAQITQIRTFASLPKADCAAAHIGGDVRGAKREDWLCVVIAAGVASWDATAGDHVRFWMLSVIVAG
jgi:hypothetical protein